MARLVALPSMVLVVVIAAIAMASPAFADARQQDNRPRVLVLPVQVAVYEVGLKSNQAESWTATAASALDAAVQRRLAASPEFDFVAAPPLSGERLAAVQAFLATASLVERSVNGIWDSSKDWPNAPVRHELGPSLSFLADETGSDYALGIVATQSELSQGMAGFGLVGTIAAAALGYPGVVLPATSGGRATAMIVHLRSGQVRWLEWREGFEVGGFNFTDLRDPASAEKVARDLFEGLPAPSSIAAPIEDPAEPDVALGRTAVGELSGGFSFNPPVGWQVRQPQDSTVLLSRNHDLDEIHVELARIPRSLSRPDRTASPDELLDRYLRDLESAQLDGFRVLASDTTGSLAGYPAFRLRFQFNSKSPYGPIPVELLTIGAVTRKGVLLAQLLSPRLGYFEYALPSFEASMATMLLVRASDHARISSETTAASPE